MLTDVKIDLFCESMNKLNTEEENIIYVKVFQEITNEWILRKIHKDRLIKYNKKTGRGFIEE